ncbi:MAG: low-specificity L-threonine aldolase [Neisseriaceae bacterium]|nr:low-specificity L-threonine aldolase [Neisseriaceae bacterium]
MNSSNVIIDLRSDTVTQPTPAMRAAMFTAEVGDDVYGDDPTVKTLETLAARRLGKEAALFVPSGTFGNQLALMTHCERGDEVILGDDSHIVIYETGGPAVLAGVQLRTIASNKGEIPVSEIASRIRTADDIHAPKTKLICLENAHSNGRVIPLLSMKSTYELATAHGIRIHLDGARIFNAASYLGCQVTDITRYADTVMCCLSKGLAAPVGSILAGNAAFITLAKRYRKMLGGGLRQSGFLAAAGLVALENMTERLAEDHALARYLADKLAALPHVLVDKDSVQINIVWFQITHPIDIKGLMTDFAANQIKVNPPSVYASGQQRMRLVTHWEIDRFAIDKVVGILGRWIA